MTTFTDYLNDIYITIDPEPEEAFDDWVENMSRGEISNHLSNYIEHLPMRDKVKIANTLLDE